MVGTFTNFAFASISSFLLKGVLPPGAGFISLQNMTDNKLMSRGELDQKEENNPGLCELHK